MQYYSHPSFLPSVFTCVKNRCPYMRALGSSAHVCTLRGTFYSLTESSLNLSRKSMKRRSPVKWEIETTVLTWCCSHAEGLGCFRTLIPPLHRLSMDQYWHRTKNMNFPLHFGLKYPVTDITWNYLVLLFMDFIIGISSGCSNQRADR